jgi:hypothetical protein
MILRLLFFFLLLAAPVAPAEDASNLVDFAASIAAAKDVPAVAALLQEQLRRPPALILQVKDKDSLEKVKATLLEVTAHIDVIAKRLAQLPALSAAERAALSKKMAASDKEYLKANQVALNAHLKAMPAELKEEAITALSGFYKTVEDHKKIFELYLGPGKRASDGEPKGGGAKPDKKR